MLILFVLTTLLVGYKSYTALDSFSQLEIKVVYFFLAVLLFASVGMSIFAIQYPHTEVVGYLFAVVLGASYGSVAAISLGLYKRR